MMVCQHAQNQSPRTDPTNWVLAIINGINYTYDYPALTSQNVCCEKSLNAEFPGSGQSTDQVAISLALQF